MKLAIMQPYFFPYIGYWQLINAVDTFVVYDNIQFVRNGWINRNYIFLNGKKTLFSLPINKGSDYLDIIDRNLAENSSKNINKILNQIINNYRQAPYFDNVYGFLESIFLYDEKNLFKYIYNSIINILSYLGIETKIIISSNVDIKHELKGVDKVIAINKALSSSHYINSIGGEKLYSKELFKKNQLKLHFLDPLINECGNLSVIDLMMWNSPEFISKMLDKYSFK